MLAYRPDIDGLRAVAVLAVVAFHAGVTGFRGGFVGVDIFFVLSGYLISGIIIRALEQDRFSFRDFYARRINRIFPALIIVLLGTFGLGWYLLFRNEFQNLGKHIAAGATFLSNAALIQESGYFDVAASRKPLLHLWSLAIEEQFYLGWPLILFLSWRYKPRFVAPALLIGVSSYVLAILASHSDQSATAFFLPFTRLWELVAGFALFATQNGKAEPSEFSLSNAKAWLGLILLFASIVFVNPAMNWPGGWTLLPVAGTALLVSAGRNAWVNRTFLAHPAMVWTGLISYPLYLWHWPLLAFARFIDPISPTIGVAVALSFLLAFLTYRFIEFPIRSRVAGRGRNAIVLIAALALIGFLGGATQRGKIASRLTSPGITSIQEALIDWNYPSGEIDLLGKIRENIIPGSADTVFFAGDSHMEQYWPRVDSLVRASGGKMPTALFFTERACPTLPGVGRIQVPPCSKLYDALMRRAASPGIRTVVLTSYWDDFFHRRLLFRLEDRARTPIELSDPRTDSMFTAFGNDLSRLVRAGKRVFVVLTIPIGANDEFDPRKWLPSRIRIDQPTIIRSISVQDYHMRSDPVLNRVRHAAESAGATVIDPVPFMCDSSKCATTDANGEALYMDSRHLRASVARTRAVWIDQTLR
jgi:peptidoglycan/LPS O-acetylase OafA/YrhL